MGNRHFANLKKRLRRTTRRLGFEVVRAYPQSAHRLPLAYPARSVSALGAVCFSLYGSHPTYLKGALENARQYPRIFPGWELVFFVGDSVPVPVLQELEDAPGVSLIQMSGYPETSQAMTWRYLGADGRDYQAVIFRDADSRPSERERAAVDEWLLSGKPYHIMRDHPGHSLAVMGGMWGLRPNASLDMGNLLSEYSPDHEFSGDQRFLRSVIYPRIRVGALVHQDRAYFDDGRGVEQRRFPTARVEGRFVGQGFDEFGNPRPGHTSDLHSEDEVERFE